MQQQRRNAGHGKGVIGLLDIGTSKVACLIAVPEPRGRDGAAPAAPYRVIGVGHQRARGLKAGVITDVDEAEASVRLTVTQAERMAGIELEDVVLSVACGRLKSQSFAANADVETGVVGENDIARVMAGGRAYAEREGRSLVHLNRFGFRLDGSSGVRDPRGMAARRLTADLHAVTVDEAPLRNLMLVVERCYLSVAGFVAAPYAAALATTSEEERRLGVTCIGIGAGTTTIATFCEGQFLWADQIPVGGNHITFDIARALQTPLAEAERIKALYGTALGAHSDEHELFSYPVVGEEEGLRYQTTKARLAQIIRPRLDHMAGLIGDRLARSQMTRFAGDRVVLTGGSAQLVGIGEYMADALGRPVRVARPQQVAGLPSNVESPVFSTAAGLLASLSAGHGAMTSRNRPAMAAGYLGRVGQWLREGF